MHDAGATTIWADGPTTDLRRSVNYRGRKVLYSVRLTVTRNAQANNEGGLIVIGMVEMTALRFAAMGARPVVKCPGLARLRNGCGCPVSFLLGCQHRLGALLMYRRTSRM